MIGLDQAQFEAAFPFHLAIGEDLEIVQCGRSFRKLCRVDPVGSGFLDLFQIRHPSDTKPTQQGFLENSGLLFVLDFKPKHLPFRGEFTQSDTGGVLLFLGSPWLADQPRLSALGLSLADFALHDSLTDLIHLIQTQRTSLEESGNLARRLKEQQAALAEAHQEAESANRAKSMFLANMSHELRTPLNSVLGFAQLMAADHETTGRQKERLEIIQRSGEHLLDLLNDLLDLSKIEAGTTNTVLAPFDIPELLSGIEDMFRQRADAKKVHFTVSIAPDVPRTVVSDVRKIRQTLLNLVGNALKFTEVGSVNLHAGWLPDGVLEFEVKDSGPGISPEHLEAIFNPFERADQTGSHADGAGLGLAICKRFVEFLGGGIRVASRIGKGSTFTASIPVTVSPEASGVVPTTDRRSADIGRYGVSGASPRVMVVDDDKASRDLLVALLREWEIEVRSGADGQEAIDLQASWQPDLIFMDIRMPGVDGAEACEIIKRLGTKAPKVVFLTASYFERQDLPRDDHSDGWLLKPIRVEDVVKAIETHLDVHLEKKRGAPAAPDIDADSSSVGNGDRIPLETLQSLADACDRFEFSGVQDNLKIIEGIDRESYARFSDLAGDFCYEELGQLVREMTTPRPESQPSTAAAHRPVQTAQEPTLTKR